MIHEDKLNKWLSNATITDIICHTDSDGLTAAAQLINKLKKMNIGYNIILGSPERLRHNNFWKRIRNDLVFFIDIPADQQSSQLIRLSNKANIVIIDHHKTTIDMNNKSIIHYYPAIMGVKKYYPSSKQVYDLFNGIDWMACIGIIGDYGGKQWREFINKVHKKYGFKECVDENCFDSPFAKYDQLISAARMIKGDKGCIKVLRTLINSSDFNDFKNKVIDLEEWSKEVDDYINYIKKDYEQNKEEVNDTVFYELNNPRYRIGSALSTIISTEHPNKTIIIMVERGENTNINLRRQDGKIRVNDLATKCAQQVGGTGGGHDKASGATIRTEYKEEFKECIKKELNNNKITNK